MTGDNAAEPGVIAVDHPLVGKLRWRLDMGRVAVEKLKEALQPFTEVAEFVGADDPEADEALAPAAAAVPVRIAKAKPAKPAAKSTRTAGDVPVPDTTPKERKIAREWAQVRDNWKACGLTKPPALYGRVEAAVIIGWVQAGRPTPA